MLVAAALLISFSILILVYYFVSRFKAQNLLKTRLAPAAAPTSTTAQSSSMGSNTVKSFHSLKRNQALNLDDLKPSNLSTALFLAGFRNINTMKTLNILLKASLLLPIGVGTIAYLMGASSLDTLMYAFIIGGGIYSVTRFVIMKMKQNRQKRIMRFLPQFMDMLVVCVEAGLSFTSSIERILKEVDPKEPLAKEFTQMYNEYLTGLTFGQACERLEKRCQVPELSFILSSIVQSEEMGASLGDTLRVQAMELRDKIKQKMRERAMKIPVKILFPLLMYFFIILGIVLGPSFYALKKMIGT